MLGIVQNSKWIFSKGLSALATDGQNNGKGYDSQVEAIIVLIPKLTWWILFEGDCFKWKKREEKHDKNIMGKKYFIGNYGILMQWKHKDGWIETVAWCRKATIYDILFELLSYLFHFP